MRITLGVQVVLLSFLYVSCVYADNASNGSMQCRSIKSSNNKLACNEKLATSKSKVTENPSVPVKKWDQEPDSFLSIKIGQPLSNSVNEVCPTQISYGFTDVDQLALDVRRTEYLCRYKSSIYTNRLTQLYSRMNTSSDSNGNVNYIRAFFDSYRYLEIVRILEAKYGPAHALQDETLTLGNGNKLPSQTLIWVGEDVGISITSLKERYFDEGNLVENGHLVITTKSRREEDRQYDMKAATDSAQKL